ncbi:MAG: hypothetical protein Ta2F_16480 [Termitinemataceae bacterium]|nr:MAG: hypothetical protein Ta2F_16480 [Termitinemataceae bacterium]
METVDLEYDIQKFIADFPWLLNINYQNIPELKDINSDMELHIEGNKRPDLILRDSLTGFPVIVEFKRFDLTRDTVGQILEYKARITAFQKEDDILFKIFENKIYAPKLVIIVRSSDIYGKIACHLQSIDVIEYGNIESKVITGDITFRKSVEDFSKTLKNLTPPIDFQRSQYLENNVYDIFYDVFKKYKIDQKWRYYNNYDIGDYWSYNNLFLNKWFLKDQEISIGIYEDILHKCNFNVCISYYSKNETKLKELKDLLSIQKNKYIDMELRPDDENNYMLNIEYESNYFYHNVKNILDFNLKEYLKKVTVK